MNKNTLKNILFIIFNIVLALALVCGLYYGMYKLKLVTLPDFLENLISGNNDKNQITVIPGDDGEIYKTLQKKQSSQTVSIRTDLSARNIKQLLANVGDNSHYYWESDVTLYSKGSSLKTKNIVRYYEGSFRVETYDSRGRLTKACADNQKKLSEKVLNLTTGRYSINDYPTGSMNLFSLAGVPDTNSFLLYGDSDNAVFSLIESNFGTLLCLEFEKTYKGLTQKEIYFVSLDYGITLRAETYENEKLVYLCETTAIKDLDAPSDDLFIIK